MTNDFKVGDYLDSLQAELLAHVNAKAEASQMSPLMTTHPYLNGKWVVTTDGAYDGVAWGNTAAYQAFQVSEYVNGGWTDTFGPQPTISPDRTKNVAAAYATPDGSSRFQVNDAHTVEHLLEVWQVLFLAREDQLQHGGAVGAYQVGDRRCALGSLRHVTNVGFLPTLGLEVKKSAAYTDACSLLNTAAYDLFPKEVELGGGVLPPVAWVNDHVASRELFTKPERGAVVRCFDEALRQLDGHLEEARQREAVAAVAAVAEELSRDLETRLATLGWVAAEFELLVASQLPELAVATWQEVDELVGKTNQLITA